MAIPEHVKRQAMDAVSNKETTAMIRAYQNSGITASPETTFTLPRKSEPQVHPIPDEVKRQAMDAVSHPETRAQIRLVRDNGQVTVPITPRRDTERIAGKIAQLHQSGQNLDATQKSITQDNFGRERD